MAAKLPNQQQRRWNRHWNYAFDDDPIAQVVWRYAKRWHSRGAVDLKEAVRCSREAREAFMRHVAEKAVRGPDWLDKLESNSIWRQS